MTDPQGREPAALDLDALEALCAEVESNKRASIAEQMQHGWRASHLLADAAPALIAEVRRLRHEGAAGEERIELGVCWPDGSTSPHAMQRVIRSVVGPWTVSEGKP